MSDINQLLIEIINLYQYIIKIFQYVHGLPGSQGPYKLVQRSLIPIKNALGLGLCCFIKFYIYIYIEIIHIHRIFFYLQIRDLYSAVMVNNYLFSYQVGNFTSIINNNLYILYSLKIFNKYMNIISFNIINQMYINHIQALQ